MRGMRGMPGLGHPGMRPGLGFDRPDDLEGPDGAGGVEGIGMADDDPLAGLDGLLEGPQPSDIQ